MIQFIYHQCSTLGRAFGFGALEGFILYLGMAIWGVNVVTNAKKVQK